MQIKIYTLSDPRTPNVIRYVGKTKQSKIKRRLDQHGSTAKRSIKGKSKKNYTIN